MKRIIIFGNSGSGKSTLSKHYAEKFNLQHLDLDILAWQDTNPPARQPLEKSIIEIKQFIAQNENWVIEGGYTDLLAIALVDSTEIIFLNLSVASCIENCKNRPWESHKYESAEKQDTNLAMLIEWVKQYPERSDVFSRQAHSQLFESYAGEKTQYHSNNPASVTLSD